MVRLRHIADSLVGQPRYTLMRGAARFAAVRSLVCASRRALQARRLRAYLSACESRMERSQFPELARRDMVRRLHADGIAFGLRLPAETCDEIRQFTERAPCFADRDPANGFRLADFGRAQQALGKPLLLAQYFNVAQACPAIARLLDDPALRWVAGSYLQSMPTFVGANLWWTFPVDALASDRDRHAHLFHRDVDDFRFFKFFFYLTDVEPGDGAHVCVTASHRRPPLLRRGDRWNLRRYSDAEVQGHYPPEQIVEVCGPAGTGFAENTLCVHKGMTPTRQPRLLLQLQYALFDYGAMHDRRESAALRMIT
jgi:hypothetical protein